MRNWKKFLRPAWFVLRGLWLRGSRRHCAVCGGSFRRFLPKGDPVRREAMCPRCLSLERHRLLGLFVDRAGIFDGAVSLLHFAPEPGIARRLRKIPGLESVTVDIAPGRADTAMDITRLAFRSEIFDRVLCCHVLEHIPEDAEAMRELLRVLRPGGSAVLQVPLREGDTDEDLSVVDPAERLRRFGQEDHVRFYGRADFSRRLTEAGFEVQALAAAEWATPREIERGRLMAEGDHEDLIFVARRPRTT